MEEHAPDLRRLTRSVERPQLYDVKLRCSGLPMKWMRSVQKVGMNSISKMTAASEVETAADPCPT